MNRVEMIPPKKLEVLCAVAHSFEKAKVSWGIGASLLLFLYGIVDEFNDIDLLVDEKSLEVADEILSKMGVKSVGAPKGVYTTRQFFEYCIDGTEVDLMCNFGIRHEGENIPFLFDSTAIEPFVLADGTTLRLTMLEDWLIFYFLIPNRYNKFRMVADFFAVNGFLHAGRIEEYSKVIPRETLKKITSL